MDPPPPDMHLVLIRSGAIAPRPALSAAACPLCPGAQQPTWAACAVCIPPTTHHPPPARTTCALQPSPPTPPPLPSRPAVLTITEAWPRPRPRPLLARGPARPHVLVRARSPAPLHHRCCSVHSQCPLPEPLRTAMRTDSAINSTPNPELLGNPPLPVP